MDEIITDMTPEEENAPDEIIIEDEETGEDEIPKEDAEGAESEPQPEKTVPLSALHSEREKLREIKKQYAESREVLDRILKKTGAATIDELGKKMSEAEYKAAVRSGMSHEAAQLFVRQTDEMRELKKMQRDAAYRDEINALRQNPFYSDIDAVSGGVTEYAAQKGLSVKEAYNALYADSRVRALTSDAQRQGEDMAIKKQSKKIAALSGEGNAAGENRAVQLSGEEAWAAKMAGMSPQEYLKYKKSEF